MSIEKLSLEKTKEALLIEFKSSMEKYGVKNVDCRFEEGNLVIEQKLGEGIRGLGYDKEEKSLWMCLDQKDPKSIKENQRWNANTLLELSSRFPGIKIDKQEEGKVKVTLDAEHPIVKLSQILGEGKSVCLPGSYNGWRRENPFLLNKDTEEMEVVLSWDGELTECKVAILNSPCQWGSGKWKSASEQRMDIKI